MKPRQQGGGGGLWRELSLFNMSLCTLFTPGQTLRDEHHYIPLKFYSKITHLCMSFIPIKNNINLTPVSPISSHSKSMESLSNRRFWATLFNQKWAFFFLICLGTTKFLLLSVFPFKETIYPRFVQNHGWGVQKVHFRLICIAHKRGFRFSWK